jgi:nitroreductase
MEPEALHKILQAGRMAGSGGNRQPWRFILVTDQASKEKLASAGRGSDTILEAPLAVIILLQKLDPDGGIRVREGFDGGRAGQNMMIAAWDQGILSCPVGLGDHDLCKEVLGYPEDYEVCLGLAFGYPKATVTAPAAARESRPRLPLAEVTHYERWGNQQPTGG